ncbi:MAG: outer membrane beta-barrel protein [Alphaproteobacteria bacterium]|nr:outer membrane beta-barrel protein [Alphaproteobacteria bacterium]
MRHSFLAGAAVAAALAASAPVSAQPVVGGPWSGLYFGGNAGAAFNPNHLDFADQSTAHDLGFNAGDNNDRFIGGAHVGYDFQPGGVVFGVEGDADFGKNINYLSSVRGRLGIPAGPLLIYGTGGWAWEGARENFLVNATAGGGGINNFSRKVNDTGWVAGAGVETYVMPAVSVGAEGLYYNFGKDTTNLATLDTAEPFAVRDNRNFAVVRARLTYHLGW